MDAEIDGWTKEWTEERREGGGDSECINKWKVEGWVDDYQLVDRGMLAKFDGFATCNSNNVTAFFRSFIYTFLCLLIRSFISKFTNSFSHLFMHSFSR